MIQKVQTTTFRGGAVRAGFTYDDATLLVTGFWCENDTAKQTSVTLNPDKISKDIMTFGSGDSSVVKPGMVVDSKDRSLPITVEASYSWR